MKTSNTLLSLVLILGFFLSTSAQKSTMDWMQFRGNNHAGVGQANDSLQQWSTVKPQLLWKKNLGSSFSEVLVASTEVYTMCSEKVDSVSGSEFAICLDAATGKENWRTLIDSIFIDVDGFGDGPRSTPAMDGESIYCLSSYGKLKALSRKNGKILWSIDFIHDYGSGLPRWAFSTSPLLHDGNLFVEIGGKDNKGFASINAKTGDVNWIKGIATPYYCSPALAEIDGVANIVFANDTMLTSYSVDGDKLWDFRMPLRFPTAAPVFVAPNKLFISSVGNNGGCMVEINDNQAKEVWRNVSMKSHFSTTCAYGDKIYGFSNAWLRCIAVETGDIIWSKRGLGKGTLIRIDDKFLVLSDKGVLKLMATNTDNFKELGSIQAIEGKSWTAPSFANGVVYVRNLEEIAAYKIQ